MSFVFDSLNEKAVATRMRVKLVKSACKEINTYLDHHSAFIIFHKDGCPPCEAFMPQVEDLKIKLADEGIQCMVISVEMKRMAEVQAACNKLNFNVPYFPFFGYYSPITGFHAYDKIMNRSSDNMVRLIKAAHKKDASDSPVKKLALGSPKILTSKELFHPRSRYTA